MGRGRIGQCRKATAWLPVLLLSSACTLFGGSGYSSHDRVVRQEPRVVAWALAETCREMLPGTEPDTAHGHPQIYQSSENHYRIRYSCPTGGPYRVAANGRLSPPQLIFVGDDLDYIAGEFSPLAVESICGNADGSLLIDIDSHPMGSRVKITIHGGADLLDATRSRIADTLLLLNASADSKPLAKAGAWQELRDLLTRIETSLRAGPASRACKMAAPLYWYRSLAHQQLGLNMATRADLSSCLDLDPSLNRVRANLLQMDDRLNRSSEALRALHNLANNDSIGLANNLIARHFNTLRMQQASNTDAEPSDLIAKVGNAIEAGDLHAAQSWLDRGISASEGTETQGTSALWGLQVRLLRAKGTYRSAFSAGLAMHDGVSRDDPRTLLDTCLDGLQLSDPSLGLRLLARNWSDLHARAPADCISTLDTILDSMDPLLAARILSMEIDPQHAKARYLALIKAPGLGSRGRQLLAELIELRQCSTLRDPVDVELQTIPGFENAPGIVPVR